MQFLETLGRARTPSNLSTALRDICTFAGWDFAQAWKPDVAERRLDAEEFWMREPRMLPYREASVASETRYGIGLLWSAFLNRKPVTCLDLTTEPTFRRAEAARRAGLKGGIFAPVNVAKATIGVVEFLSCNPKPDDENRGWFATAAVMKFAHAFAQGV